MFISTILGEDISVINELVDSIFSGCVQKRWYVSAAPEIENYVVLEAQVRDSVENILRKERLFYKRLLDKVDAAKLKFFVFKCEMVAGTEEL